MHDDEQAIRQVVATWLSASQAGDLENVLGLMTEDVVFLTPGRPPMRGKATFAAGQTALQAFRMEATADIQEIKVFGDLAYCWNTLTIVMTPRDGGASMKRVGNTLSIFRKEAGRWLLARDANMLAAVPA